MRSRTGWSVGAVAPAAGMMTVTLLAGMFLGAAGAAGAEDSDREGRAASASEKESLLDLGRVTVGGYMDLVFRADESGSTFDLHQFVPEFHAEISDHVRMAGEIEFEHGGAVSGEEETDGEIEVEFATMDFLVTEALNFRGGLVLSPLGRLNVFHDAPMRDLTDRPLVDTEIIPTTLSEAGLGVYGAFYPTEALMVDYQGYVVNGFNADVVQGGRLDLREGRGSFKQDNNNARSFVGRLGVSPRVGTEVGVSVHTGSYDDAGDYNLTLAALDASFFQGPVEILGEGALATAEYAVDTTLTVTETADARAAGFYLEGRLHFLAGAVRALPQSVFTGVVRVDYIDRDRDVDGYDRQRITFGVNFRPTEATVIKNDLVLDRSRDIGVSDWGDTHTGYRMSLATFF